MKTRTQLFKIIKKIIKKYGLWQTAITISLSISLPILLWQLADIINAMMAFVRCKHI